MDAPFYLTVFGGLALRGPDGSLGSAVGKRRLVLLARLAAAGERGVSRDSLGALFWPESDDARARGALKQAVYALRSELGSEAIPATSTGYALSFPHVGCDLHDFRRALDAAEPGRAVALYGGPFLAGVYLDGAAELGEWIEGVRRDLEADYRKALLALLGAGQAPPEQRSEWAQRLLALDRADVQAAELLVVSLMEAGRIGQARRAVGEYERWVRDEFGGVPDAAVAAALATPSRARPHPARDGEGWVAPPAAPAPPADAPVAEPSARRSSTAGSRRHVVSRTVLAAALGLAALTTVLWQPGRDGGDRRGPVMDLQHVAKHPVYLRVASLGSDSTLAAAALVLREALAAAIPQAPAFVGVFRAPEDSVRFAQLPGRDTMAAPFDVTAELSFVADSAMVFLRAENQANPAIATTATLQLGTRLDPLARLDDTVERLLGALALRTDTDSLSTLVTPLPPRYDSYSRFKSGFEAFHGNWDERMFQQLLSASALDSAWVAPVYYAVRAYDAMEEFNRSDSLIASTRRRLTALPEIRKELDTLAQSRAQSRASIGSASLPPAEVLLRRQPNANGPRFYETARQYYAAGRPAEAALLLARIDSAGGVLSPTDGSSYWLRGLSLHSAGQYEKEMALAEQRFRRSPSGISSTEYFDYIRAMAAVRLFDRILPRFDSLPPALVGTDEFIYRTFALGGEVRFHGDSAVARALFRRAADACEQRERTLLHYRHYCALAHIAVGDTAQARAWVERLSREPIDPLTVLGLRGLLAAAAGRSTDARAALRQVGAYRDNLRYGRADFWRARILAQLGDREGAIAALAEAKRNGWFPFWGVHSYFHWYPELAQLEDDPRVRPYWIVDRPN